jgi:hypothetical protein
MPRALSRNTLSTDPFAPDPALRGRAYPIQFDRVWSAALVLGRDLRGWSVSDVDPRNGQISAEVHGWPLKRRDHATIVVSLDELGLTRVDLRMTPLTFRIGRRVSRRRIERFLTSLDSALQQ